MKKSTLMAFGLGLFACTAFAQNAQEVTYVEDPAQGYLFNRFKDNWFIQAEGGAAVAHSQFDQHRKFGDRITPSASLYVGKWFSPLLGVRGGLDFLATKGLTNNPNAAGAQPFENMVNGYYKTRDNYVGPVVDFMLSLTNWWCGYKPNRVYNAYFYAGGGLYWTIAKFAKPGETEPAWHNAHNKTINIRAGLVQDFRLCDRFSLGLDLRCVAITNPGDEGQRTMFVPQALLSATYHFGKTEWNAPVVPVCPPAENCDEYRARLQAADARIADLEAQLKACLSRPVEKVVESQPAALATIYYPCGVYRLTSVDRKVLKSVANAMKETNKDYVLTGWADNYTGTDAINVRLRENRVNTVKKQLVKYGVDANKLDAKTNNANRTDLGDKCLTLDRCVTIFQK